MVAVSLGNRSWATRITSSENEDSLDVSCPDRIRSSRSLTSLRSAARSAINGSSTPASNSANSVYTLLTALSGFMLSAQIASRISSRISSSWSNSRCALKIFALSGSSLHIPLYNVTSSPSAFSQVSLNSRYFSSS